MRNPEWLSNLLPPHDVARRLGVSVARVRQLDAELRPVRLTDGRRIYELDVIQAYLAVRDARRASQGGGSR